MKPSDADIQSLAHAYHECDFEELLRRLDGAIRGEAHSANAQWRDDLAQDVRIALYQWMMQRMNEQTTRL